ncbi:MAG: FAD-binding protein [Eggerthellaceae bacterium]|nr:FAD-binding protein [Eggerthellaceae bacterium]
MGIAAGGHTVGERLWGHVCTTNIHGFHNAPDDTIAANGFLVNKNGETFVENGNDNSMAYALIAEQPDECAFTIVDSASGFAEVLDEGLESGDYSAYVFKADTIDELAELCEIDAAKLQNTIDEYNNHLATRGEFDPMAYDLIESPEFIGATPIEEGPFYAVKFVQVHLGSCVGLVVDGDCKVLDEKSGQPIENLFATGECCIGGNVFDLHVGGWGIGGACYSGRIAGETAKAELLA